MIKALFEEEVTVVIDELIEGSTIVKSTIYVSEDSTIDADTATSTIQNGDVSIAGVTPDIEIEEVEDEEGGESDGASII